MTEQTPLDKARAAMRSYEGSVGMDEAVDAAVSQLMHDALRQLISEYESADAKIKRALALPHGPFGPWEDDLASWDLLYAALTEEES